MLQDPFKDADGNDPEKIERAVALLYRHLRLPRPELHWADFIFEAMVHAETLRPAANSQDAGKPTIGQRCRKKFLRLAKNLSLDGEPRADFLPRVHNVARLEHEDGIRELRPVLIDPKVYYREQIGESLTSDEPKIPLSHGWTPFHENYSFLDVSMAGMLLLVAAREKCSKALSKSDQSLFEALVGLAANCYWAFLTESYVIVAKSPNGYLWDSDGRPHCDFGPAIMTRERREIFAQHGVWVPREAIMEPQALRVQDIEVEPEVNTRDLMIESYGLERYMRDSGALLWHKDQFGELYWKSQHCQSPLLAVRVTNKTPEPDGHCKDYWLRVPPHIATAREAVAWTFRMEEQEYMPAVES